MTLAWIRRDESLERLVVIAPHGRDYHRRDDGKLLAAVVACSSHTAQWISVDVELALLLERQPCGQCWPNTHGEEE